MCNKHTPRGVNAPNTDTSPQKSPRASQLPEIKRRNGHILTPYAASTAPSGAPLARHGAVDAA